MESNIWVKSTRSGSNGECVEVRHRGEQVDMRDSKDPNGPVLVFGAAEFAAFICTNKDGELIG